MYVRSYTYVIISMYHSICNIMEARAGITSGWPDRTLRKASVMVQIPIAEKLPWSYTRSTYAATGRLTIACEPASSASA